jgi:diaminopimelate decarboxylase
MSLEKFIFDLAKQNETPAMVWDLSLVKKRIKLLTDTLKKYDVDFIFPVKSFPDNKVLGMFAKFGFGFDCSNQNEIGLVKKYKKSKISITGPLAKTISCNNVDYFDIDSSNQVPKIGNFGIRFNFNNQNGFAPSRFGVGAISELYVLYDKYDQNMKGIHIHISDDKQQKKKIPDILNAYKNILNKLDYINIGGSWSEFSISELERIIKELREFINIKTKIILEAGDFWFNGAGHIIASVIDTKELFDKKFHIFLDISKTLHCGSSTPKYKENLSDEKHSTRKRRVFFFGATCAENDFIDTDLISDGFKIGDKIHLMSITCYAAALNHSFNGIPKIKVLFYE